MSEADVTWVLFGSLVATLLLGIPVGYALGISTALGLLLTPIPLVYISQTFYTGVGLFPLIAKKAIALVNKRRQPKAS